MTRCKMHPLLNNKDYKMNVLNRTMMNQVVDSSISTVREVTYRTKGQYNGFATRLFSPSDLGHEVKPFIFLDFFKVKPNRRHIDAGWHPHSGISTVTYLFKGSMRYKESTGVEGVLPSGGVEYMQAGNGVWHTGGATHEEAEGFQLWLALPASAENGESKSQYLEPNQVPSVGPVKVILGHYQGVQSEAKIESDLSYLHVSLKAGQDWTFTPEIGHKVAWISMYKGVVNVANADVNEGEVVVFEESNQSITFHAETDVDFILGGANKHPFPLVMGSYSVHTNRDALRQGESNIAQLGYDLQQQGIIPSR